MASQSESEQQGTGVATNAADTTQSSDFQRLLTTEVRFPPSPEALAAADIKDYQTLYDEAKSNPEAFWDKIAREFTWIKPWNSVFEGQAPGTRWFVGAQLNITSNCLDRHAHGSRAH